MRTKKLSPQQRWNRKHKSKLNESSRKYYYKNKKTILQKLRVKYIQKKQLKIK